MSSAAGGVVKKLKKHPPPHKSMFFLVVLYVCRKNGEIIHRRPPHQMRPSGKTRTNLTVERLSLNRSQCGGCSTKYDTPTDELGRLRMISHRCAVTGGHHLDPAGASLPPARGQCRGFAAAPGTRVNGTRVRVYRRLPATAVHKSIVTAFWAGFRLRGVQS